MSIVALAIMRAATAHSEATGARTSVSAHDGLSAWWPVSGWCAHGAGAPYCPANVGISDTTTHATHGPDPNTRTATVQPEPPTRHACANTGRNNELTNNSGPAWALAFVRSQLFARAARFRVADRCSFFVSKTFSFRFRSRAVDDDNNRVSELKTN